MLKKISWIEKFFFSKSKNLTEKCNRLYEHMQNVGKDYPLHGAFAVSLEGGLDRKITVTNPWSNIKEQWICFDSNGYLGLQHNQNVKNSVIQAIDNFGAGTPSVPLLGGSNFLMAEVASKIAKMHQRDDALIFSSGYSANVGVISGLIRKNDAIIIDEKAHASLHQGAQSSRCENIFVFKNNDMSQLEEILTSLRQNDDIAGILIITDGIFSMSGQIVPLKELISIAKKFNATTLVDEAHSVGVVGPKGHGVEDYFNLFSQIDIITGTFSKAFGFVGGYVASRKEVVNYLKYNAGSWVFSTSMPIATLAGINASIDEFNNNKDHLYNFKSNRDLLWSTVQNLNIRVPEKISGILPIVTRSNECLLESVKIFSDFKIKCGAVTFPAVSRGQGLIRVIPTARHVPDDFLQLAEALKNIKSHNLII